MFLCQARFAFVIYFFGFCYGALKLSPALNQTERYVNDSYVVTCFGENATGAKWTGPENFNIPSGVGRIHTEERNDYVSLVFDYIRRNDTGHYRCIKDNETVSFKLTVVKPIKFRGGLEEQNIVVGNSDQVKCEAEGIPQPSFMWHVNGSLVKGRRYTQLPGGLHIMNVTRDDKGIYLCRAYQLTTQTSIVMDQIINVTVHYMPVWKTSQDWYGYVGGIANLTCEVEAEPFAEFTWAKNNQTLETPRIISGPNRSVLQINITDETVFGVYECKAWNELGSIRRTGELKEGIKPDPPSKVIIEPTTSHDIKLTVTWATENQNNMGIRIEFIEFNEPPITWENASYTDLYEKDGPYILKDLKTKTNYMLRVASLGEAGLSDFTEDLRFLTSHGIIMSSCQILTFALILFFMLHNSS